MVQRTNGAPTGQRMRIVSTTPGQTVYRTAPNGNTVVLRQSPARPAPQGKNIIVVGNQGKHRDSHNRILIKSIGSEKEILSYIFE